MKILAKNEAVLISGGEGDMFCMCATHYNVPLWDYTNTVDECKKICCDKNNAVSYSSTNNVGHTVAEECNSLLAINILIDYIKNADSYMQLRILKK